jgi:hypothetical protein
MTIEILLSRYGYACIVLSVLFFAVYRGWRIIFPYLDSMARLEDYRGVQEGGLHYQLAEANRLHDESTRILTAELLQYSETEQRRLREILNLCSYCGRLKPSEPLYPHLSCAGCGAPY